MLTKRHRIILENKGSDSATIKRKSDAWDEIAINMNAAGFHRTKERLKQQLGRIKSAEAKKAKDALATEILKSDFKSTESSKVGSCMQEKNSYKERKKVLNEIAETNSEFQSKNCTTHGDEVIIKMEKAISIDEFEDLPTELETTQRSSDQVTPVLKNRQVENEELETNSLSSYKTLHSDNQMLFHRRSSGDSCKTFNSKSNRKKIFVRSHRIHQLHQIRIAIERERLLALRLQRKRDNLLYQKDMQIQNMKMQILQNLINQNKNNHINL